MVDLVSIAGTIVSLVSMGVTISQARSAKKSNTEAKKILTAINMTSVAVRLKTAQEHIISIMPANIMKRGFKPGDIISSVHKEFDAALNDLPSSGEGSNARDNIVKAQTVFNNYCASFATPDRKLWEELRSLIQDAISSLTSMKI